MVFYVDILFSITHSQTAAQSQGVDDCVEPEQKRADMKFVNIKSWPKYQEALKTAEEGTEGLGLPGRRPHRLGDLVTDGPVVASHVHRSSLVGKKVLRTTVMAFQCN